MRNNCVWNGSMSFLLLSAYSHTACSQTTYSHTHNLLSHAHNLLSHAHYWPYLLNLTHTQLVHTHNLPPHTTTAGRHGHVYVPDTSCEHDQTDGRVVALLCVVALAFGVRDALRTFQCLLGSKLAVGVQHWIRLVVSYVWSRSFDMPCDFQGYTCSFSLLLLAQW